MKLNRRWIGVAFIISLSLFLFLLAKAESVRATFSDLHAVTVLMRFDTDVLQKTPAGQYYEALFWKHDSELTEIARQYPEHRIEFSHVTLLFIPELEAFLDGKGDTVYVTYEQLESLKTELEWFASVGSPSLREDIHRELQRFPLDQFVGMTMNEAYDVVNSSWISDGPLEKLLVPDSDGKWAYYIHNGVYFEYPASYNLQVSGSQSDHFYLIPSGGMPEYWNSCVVGVRILYVPVQEKDGQNPRSRYSDDRILWERNIELLEFPGIAFATVNPDYPTSMLQSYQFNEASQRAVHLSAIVYGNSKLTGSLDYTEIENHRFEYFQHMVASIRIQQP
jgi:hypothetical protein